MAILGQNTKAIALLVGQKWLIVSGCKSAMKMGDWWSLWDKICYLCQDSEVTTFVVGQSLCNVNLRRLEVVTVGIALRFELKSMYRQGYEN